MRAYQENQENQGERSLPRAGVMGISRRGMRGVGRASFRCHRGKRKNEKDDMQREEPLTGLVPNNGFRETV
jgi:hypothetical protein